MVDIDLGKLSAPLEELRTDVDAAYKRLDSQWDSVAKQLSKCFFMPCNSVCFDQRDEVIRPIPPQRGFGVVRIRGNESVSDRVDIGEVAAPATRDQDLLAGRVGMVDQHGPAAALTSRRSTHQPTPPAPRMIAS